jgi:hypothetical protein
MNGLPTVEAKAGKGVSFLALIDTVERVARLTGLQMNRMRALQEAGRMHARMKRYFPLHVSAAILEVPVLNEDGTPSGVVRRVVQKPGATYRRPA